MRGRSVTRNKRGLDCGRLHLEPCEVPEPCEIRIHFDLHPHCGERPLPSLCACSNLESHQCRQCCVIRCWGEVRAAGEPPSGLPASRKKLIRRQVEKLARHGKELSFRTAEHIHSFPCPRTIGADPDLRAMTHNSGRTSKSEVCTIHKVVRAIAAEKRGMRGLNYLQRNAILEWFCTRHS